MRQERWYLPRLFPFCLLAGLLLLLGGCGGSGGQGAGGDTLVTVSLGRPRAARTTAVPSSIRRLRVTVTGPAMDDVTKTVAVGADGPVSLSVAVPAGPDRTFGVEALDASDAVRYLGSTTVAVAGESQRVTVALGLSPTNPALGRWRWRNPAPTGEDLWAVAYGDGTFVAVGTGGTILTSSDAGSTWTARFAASSSLFSAFAVLEPLVSVAYDGNGTFVAVGPIGAILTSHDTGDTWVSVGSANNTSALLKVTYGNGRFLAAGANGTVLISQDHGRTWIQAENNLPASSVVTALAFGGGVFYAAVAAAGNEGGGLYSSDDGVTWTERGVGRVYEGMAFGGGRLLATNSSDILAPLADTTTPVYTGGVSLHDVSFGGGFFAAVGDSGEILVADATGAVWTYRGLDSNDVFRGVAVGAGTVVAVGEGGVIATAGVPGEGTSRPAPVSGGWAAVGPLGFGGGTFVAGAGSDQILASPDGTTWTAWTQPSDLVGALSAFAYGAGTFVAVGPLSSKPAFEAAPTSTVCVSTDGGQTWSDGDRGPDGPLDRTVTDDLVAVAFGDGTFVAVSPGEATYRTVPPAGPGGSWRWARVVLPNPWDTSFFLKDIAYGAGTFVAVGDEGATGSPSVVFTSTDGGETWSPVADFSPPGLDHIVYADGAFVTGGPGLAGSVVAAAYSSPDGRTWTKGQDYAVLDAPVTGVAYGAGAIVAVDGTGALHASTDNGATWLDVPFFSTIPVTSVTFGNGTFLVGGGQGVLLQSEPL